MADGAPVTLVDVALPVPLLRTFTYRLPNGASAPPGVRVRVPFGARAMVGVVLGPGDPVTAKLRDVTAVLDAAPILTAQELAFARWLADYYLAPMGDAVSLLLPPRMADGEEAPSERTTTIVRATTSVEPPSKRLGPRTQAALEWIRAHGEETSETIRAATGVTLDGLRRLEAAGLLTLDDERRFRDPMHGANLGALRTDRATPLVLNPAQIAAAETFTAALGTFRGFLLRGVTGSGKTEVYLALIEAALARGLGTIVLVPEIALTPQLVARFRARLGERVAIQHSGLEPAARHEQWLRIAAGDLRVVIGARSALFAPVRDLGAVIVDEEHEPSFKQESSPRYHARDLALVRGQLAKAPVILGSATPSVESWANVQRGKLARVDLAERAGTSRDMPATEVVDMRTAAVADPDRILSVTLMTALAATLEAGEQAILFLNRRGFSSFVLCRACGTAVACESCSVSYTWHRGRGRLVCHYCDRTRAMPPRCPTCGEPELAELGFGTEQVEARVHELLPNARLQRMDKDTTRGRALFKLLTQFRKREIDVLIGTQMVAKGHDFPGVTLVGVLAADHGLAFPDFRAAERTFQLLTQIAGRAGRGDRPGRVLVQTHAPDHYAIRHALAHDATGFLATELGMRRARGFPPDTHLALFRVSGAEQAATAATAEALARALRDAAKARGPGVDVHAAQPAPIERVKDRWRYQVLVSATDRRALRAVLDATRPTWAEARLAKHLQIALDVDPQAFL